MPSSLPLPQLYPGHLPVALALLTGALPRNRKSLALLFGIVSVVEGVG
jgi:hypothetical protein